MNVMAVMRGGPSDGLCIDAVDHEVGVWDWAWLPDRSMKINRFGTYRIESDEWSFIDGTRFVHYHWQGWLWGTDL